MVKPSSTLFADFIETRATNIADTCVGDCDQKRAQRCDFFCGLCRDLVKGLRGENAVTARNDLLLEELIRESSVFRTTIKTELETFLHQHQGRDKAIDAQLEQHVETFLTALLVDRAATITAEREREREASERYAQAILNSALDCIIVIGQDGRVREWNPAAEKLFGYRRDEAIGRELAELIIPPELQASHRRGLAHFLATGEGPLLGHRIEVEGVCADGSRRQLELSITPYQAEGKWTFTAYLRDITQRKLDESAARRLAAVVRSSSDAIVAKDLRGIITNWNEGARKLFGYTEAEVVGKSITILIPSDRISEEREILSRIRAGELVESFETVRERKNGKMVEVSITVSPIRDAEGKVIGASKIARDITRTKQAERAQQLLLQQVQAASQAKDRFLATLSHELRTPLNPVLMWACSAIDDPNLDPKMEEGLRMVCRNIELEARLIDDMLDLTRITRGKVQLKREACDASAVLRHALEIMASEIRSKNLRLVTDLTARNHNLMADCARLEQVFWNLLKNAQKYTPPGGEISVRTCNPTSETLRLEIGDTGPGIEAALMPKLFDAFEQGENTSGGLGLGLAISKGIVELHGGSLTSRNRREGHGAIFTIEMQTTAEKPSAPPAQPETSRSRQLRVLIVEDHPETLMVMRRLLEGAGHQVSVASTVREAVDIIQGSSLDLLISDLGLPDGNGLEVMRSLAKKGEAKGIAISGYGMEDDLNRSRGAGFSAHLTKPINAEELRRVIQTIVEAADGDGPTPMPTADGREPARPRDD